MFQLAHPQLFGLNLLLHFQFRDPVRTMAIIIVGTTLLGGETQLAYLHLAPLQRLDYNEAILGLLSVRHTDRLLCYWASLVMNAIRTC